MNKEKTSKMIDEDKYLIDTAKILVSIIILLVGFTIGMYIEKPIAYEQGKLDQQAFDVGAYDAFALYWYNYSNATLDLRYYSYVPTKRELNDYSSHPYIQGWLYYNETKELRPNIIPVFLLRTNRTN